MKHNTRTQGFTLIEMLVVMAIIVTLSAIVLQKYQGYDTNANFANATENIVLAVRQAQVYGVAVRANSTGSFCGGVTVFDCAYGVNFATASPGGLTLFVDNNDNGLYDGGAELVQSTSWVSPTTISGITCNGGACGGGILNITFKRPSTLAVIRDGSGTLYNTSAVTITDGAKTSVVTVTKAGQISIQ